MSLLEKKEAAVKVVEMLKNTNEVRGILC